MSTVPRGGRPAGLHGHRGAPFRLSIAAPVYNEEAGILDFVRRALAVLDEIPGGPHELLLVDDGSHDRSLELMDRAAEADPRVVVVELSRNFGHQAALTAALEHVTGDAVVLMDADLQDTPESIPEFVRQYAKGYDVVYAQRVRRKEGALLRASYFLFYRLMGKLANVELPLDAGDFGLMSRRVVDELRRTPERHRYLRGLRSWVGFAQLGVPVERAARAKGESKYSWIKLLRLAADGIFSFSIAPLRAAAVIGAAAIALTAAFSLYALYEKLFLDRSPKGFTALILVISFLSGVNLFFLGVIGEYVGRVFEQVKGRPQYVVSSVRRGNVVEHRLRASGGQRAIGAQGRDASA